MDERIPPNPPRAAEDHIASTPPRNSPPVPNLDPPSDDKMASTIYRPSELEDNVAEKGSDGPRDDETRRRSELEDERRLARESGLMGNPSTIDPMDLDRNPNEPPSSAV